VDQLHDRHLRVRRPAPARLLAALAAAALLAGGCQFPRDTDGTLDRLRDGGPLRVGVTEHEPWVTLDGPDPGGVEVGLVRELAARLGARVEYTSGSEEELVETLRDRELDLVIGGITDRTLWEREVAMTKPYLTTHLVVGSPGGREPPEGDRVAVERGTVAAPLLERKTGWVPVVRESLEGVRGPAVADNWLLDDLRLQQVEALQHDEHVMLAAPGENGFLVALEHFLLERRQRALELLAEEGRP
jgi:polar amino acid transport system substrate-binding protein